MTKRGLSTFLTDEPDHSPVSRVVRALSRHGPLSAVQLTKVTGLAKSTVSTTLAELRSSGIVVDGGSDRTGGAGRPATTVMLSPKAGYAVGVLLGSEQFQIIVADVSHSIVAEHYFDLQLDYPPDLAAQMVRDQVSALIEEKQLPRDALLGVGIAIAGPINPRTGKVVRSSGLPTWTGIDVRAVFASVLEWPVFVSNESNCAAIAEMTWGAARGRDDFLLFTLDLGVGGAVVMDGHVVLGAAGAAGEFGHISLDPDGELCRCGNWYFSVFGGGLLPQSATFNYVGNATTYDIFNNPGWIVGGAVGVKMMDAARVEVELSYTSQGYYDVDGSGYAGRTDTTAVLANLWFDIGTGTAFTPYVGGGVGAGLVTLDDFDGYFDSPSVWNGFGFVYQVGGGVVVDVSENVSLDLGYRYRSVLSTVVNPKGFDGNLNSANHVFLAGLHIGM